jgi:hypothetical protein
MKKAKLLNVEDRQRIEVLSRGGSPYTPPPSRRKTQASAGGNAKMRAWRL